ncbi:helix-turn-helix transcriptional regulator [Neptuniibacter sp. QD37_11]|uniref:helix-turn-helix transcriptional regulator n=1 Tax=Neptuniibacter sp. QD37_11 TaxID=3398209 RepID=UPI0039F5AFA2
MDSPKHTRISDSLLLEVQKRFDQQEAELALLRRQETLVPIDQLGQAIIKARNAQKLSQEDLEDLSEVSRTTIIKLEKNDLNVSFSTMQKVLKALGLKLWVG